MENPQIPPIFRAAAAAPLGKHLRRVRSVRFTSRDPLPNGWTGRGTGEVAVDEPSESVLTFTESGLWQPRTGRALRFRNVFQWSWPGGEIVRLEHLRFGADRPVFLFDLAPRADGTWTAVAPHRCGEDCYSARLRLCPRGLRMTWTIRGPGKQAVVQYQYFW